MKNKEKYIVGNRDIDATLVLLDMWIRKSVASEFKKQIGLPKPKDFIEIIKSRTLNYYLTDKNGKNFIDQCAKNILSNAKLLKFLRTKTIKTGEKVRKFGQELYKNINSIPFNDLAPILEKIDKLQTDFVIFGLVIAFADILGGITNQLLNIVNKRKNLKYPTHFYTTILGTSEEKSLTEKAYLNIKNKKTDIKDLLAKYFWLDQGYVGRGLKRKELEKIRKTKREIKKYPSRNKLIHELKLNKKESKIFKISQDVIYLKTLRADSRQFLYVITNKIIDRVAKNFKIKSKYLESICMNELIALLKNGASLPRNLKARWQRSIIFSTGSNRFKIITGVKAERFVVNHFAQEKNKYIKEIKGQIAQPGKVRGKIKLVFGPQHNKKVRRGDVLVSAATSPQLLPAMKIAAAFITDVGGITSHAAIVARELGKPCIVGTKIASQILKDGDLVDVDAINGIIKKI